MLQVSAAYAPLGSVRLYTARPERSTVKSDPQLQLKRESGQLKNDALRSVSPDTMLLSDDLRVPKSGQAGGKVGGRKKIKTPILEICQHPKFPIRVFSMSKTGPVASCLPKSVPITLG